jgi:hypothetical protein
MLSEEPVRAPKLVQLGIEENIPISGSVSMVKGVYFELTDPVDIPGLKENGNDIELHFDTTEKNKLMAFVIWVSGPTNIVTLFMSISDGEVESTNYEFNFILETRRFSIVHKLSSIR